MGSPSEGADAAAKSYHYGDSAVSTFGAPKINMHNIRRSLCLAIAGLLVMTLSSFSHAEDRKIGVAVSAVINGSTDDTGTEVSEALGAAIETVLKATVISGTEAQNLLPEAARSETCLGDAACLVAAGQRLGVDELLMLIIIDSAQEVKVEATWVNVATGKTALRRSISAAKSSDAMAELFLANASELLPDVELRPQEKDPDPIDPIDNGTGNGANNTGDLTNNGGQTDTGSGGGGRYVSTTTLAVGIAGGVMLLGATGLLIERIVECGGGGCDESLDAEGKKKENFSKGKNTAADALAVGGALTLTIAYFLYRNSESETQAPAVSVTATDDSLGFVYGGRF